MTPTPSQEERREAIARIVDPGAWRRIDAQHEDYPADPWERFLSSPIVARSLAKADAIIALDPPTFPVSEEAARECLARVAQRLADQSDEPFPGPAWQRLHYWRSKAIEASRELERLAAFRGSGVVPEASGAPLRGQALLASLPEPVPVSALPGDDPSRNLHLELRPDSAGEFDEIVARFADGMVHVETLDDNACYVGFTWDDGRYCQWWFGSKKKLWYNIEEGEGDPPRYTAQGVDRMPWLPDYSASAMSGRSPETEGLSPKDASATAEGGDAQNTPDPTPLSGKD